MAFGIGSVQVTSMKTGPAQAISKTFVNVTKVTYDIANGVVKVEGINPPYEIDIDISAATTISDTISGANRTIAIS